MKLLVVASLCLALAYAQSDYAQIWESWKAKHGRSYEGAEDTYRFRVFSEAADMIAKHNLEESVGLHTFKMGLTQFADLTHDEFKAQYLMNTLPPKEDNLRGEPHVMREGAPDSMDWRTQGAVTAVKNQGGCGSCWSFGASGALEGAYFIKNGKLLSFSEQQQVDCNRNCYGCNGGWAEYAFYYWQTSHGAELESDYTYTGRDQSCKANNYQTYTQVTKYVNIQSGSETGLQNAVGTVGPTAITIDASRSSFQYYTSGVYYDSGCSSSSLDHVVLAVGYGSGSGGDYWIVKNSWGTWWGENGYINMARNRNNNCGVATEASYPMV
jgi:cathepsin L